MDWKNARRSANVSDRRGGGKAPLGILGTIIVIIGVIFGQDVGTMLGLVETGAQFVGQSNTQQVQNPTNDEQSDFIRVVLGANEDLWQAQFQKYGLKFRPAQLVLFSNRVQSACGAAGAEVGPFYCSADEKIYVDLNFINDMRRLGASNSNQVAGNFAMAYVIGHEYGHHISNLTGTLPKTHQAMAKAGTKSDKNALSVRRELQADCYAGVWAANLAKYKINLNEQDISAGLTAASAVGDDRIMKSAGYSDNKLNPENFTHGSAQQRKEWFARGLQAREMTACDTFR